MGSFVRLVAILTSASSCSDSRSSRSTRWTAAQRLSRTCWTGSSRAPSTTPHPIAPTPDQEAAREQVNGTFHEAGGRRQRRPARPVHGPRRLDRSLGHPRGARPCWPCSCTASASGCSRTCCRRNARPDGDWRHRLAQFARVRRAQLLPPGVVAHKQVKRRVWTSTRAAGTGEPTGWQPCRPGANRGPEFRIAHLPARARQLTP